MLTNKIKIACLSALLIGSALQAMDVEPTELGKQLITAIRNDNPVQVEKLLSEGVDPNSRTDEGTTALILAAKRGYLEICRLLIARGADVNLRANNRDGDSALIGAARRGFVGICRLLLKHGANINQLDNFGNTALVEALRWSQIAVCKLLIDAKLEAPIDPARLAGINLTPAQRSKVVTLLSNLEITKVPGHQHLQPDTRRLIVQSLSNTYKLINMIRAQIEAANMLPERKQELLEYLNQK